MASATTASGGRLNDPLFVNTKYSHYRTPSSSNKARNSSGSSTHSEHQVMNGPNGPTPPPSGTSSYHHHHNHYTRQGSHYTHISSTHPPVSPKIQPSELLHPNLFKVIHAHTTTRSHSAEEVKDHARIAEFLTIVVFFLWHRELFPKKSLRRQEILIRRQEFQKFTEHIVKSAKLSYASVMIALKYIHRFVTYNPSLRGEEGSELRLFISSLIVANKYLEDHYYSKKAWMQVCHFTKDELNIMELEFLSAIRFNLAISERDYEAWLDWVLVFTDRLEVYSKKGQSVTGSPMGVMDKR